MDKPPHHPARKSRRAPVANTAAAICCRSDPPLPPPNAESPSETAKCFHESAESSPKNPAKPLRVQPPIPPPARVASPRLAPHHPASPYTAKPRPALGFAHPNKSVPPLPRAQAAYQKPPPSSAAPPHSRYCRWAQALRAAPQLQLGHRRAAHQFAEY